MQNQYQRMLAPAQLAQSSSLGQLEKVARKVPGMVPGRGSFPERMLGLSRKVPGKDSQKQNNLSGNLPRKGFPKGFPAINAEFQLITKTNRILASVNKQNSSVQ